MRLMTSRFVWKQTEVCGKNFLLPGSVHKVEKGPSKIKYWRLSIRIDGIDYIYTYRISESETIPLMEALGSLVIVIYAFGLPSRLHKKNKGRTDPTLPVGISGPYTEGKKRMYHASIPGIGRPSKDLRVYINDGDTATALEEAKRLRASGVAAYKVEAEIEASQVIAEIWQLVEALDLL